jgi:hypothetical protein
MMIWKDYLFVARAAALDVYGPLSGSPSWSNSWQTITSDSLWHPMLVSFNDNKLYGGAGKFVFSLDEASGSTFAPGTASTYTWTAQALDLPPNYRIKSLEELGNNLMCGTWMGSAIDDFEVADIFPWDRSSSSFGSPIKLKENGANALLTVNNLLYIFAGIGGTIYISNSTLARYVITKVEYFSVCRETGQIVLMEWAYGLLYARRTGIFSRLNILSVRVLMVLQALSLLVRLLLLLVTNLLSVGRTALVTA